MDSRIHITIQMGILHGDGLNNEFVQSLYAFKLAIQ